MTKEVSDWQDGVPPCDGVWEIAVPEDKLTYFARFKHGQWGGGFVILTHAIRAPFIHYPINNNPDHPRKWRGVIEDEE